MKRQVLIATVLIGLAAATTAQDDEKGQSVMFKNRQHNYDHLTTVPDRQQQGLGDQCMEMSRKIKSLKGKPQRRAALMERYRHECERDTR